MNKQQLINNIANLSDMPKMAVERVLGALANTIQMELGRDGDVTVPGIGKFSSNYRAGRIGRNPATGETLEIAGKFTPKFTASKALKDAVN